MENKKSHIGFLVAATILFVLVLAALLFFILVKPGNNNSRGISPTATNGTADAAQENETTTISKAEAQEGDIGFNPDGGEYMGRVRIQLSFKPLKSSRGDVIASNICYTLNGTDPSRTNGKQYPRSGSIDLKREGTYTLKVRLISKVGEYAGGVFSRVYTIKPDTLQVTSSQASPDSMTVSQPGEDTVKKKPGPSNPRPETRSDQPENNTVTDFDSLDTNTKDDIRESMKLITIEVEGIATIKKNGDLKFLITVSKDGKGELIDVSGFDVEPTKKMAEIRFALKQKIEGINFNPPTMDENPVDTKVWVDFKKVAKFYEKVIFER